MSDIPAGDRKIGNLFLQCIAMCGLALPGVDILQSGEDLTGENHAARREIRGLKNIATMCLI